MSIIPPTLTILDLQQYPMESTIDKLSKRFPVRPAETPERWGQDLDATSEALV